MTDTNVMQKAQSTSKNSDEKTVSEEPVNQLTLLIRKYYGFAFSIILILCIWQLSATFLPVYILPGIDDILRKGVGILGESKTYYSIGLTLQRLIGGFLLSSLIGVTVGIFIGVNQVFRNIFLPFMNMIMGVPAITWVLLSIVWFPSMEARIWMIMIVIVFPITAVNTYDGIRSVPTELREMVKSLRPSSFNLLRLVIIPAAAPFIFSGLRVSLSFASRIGVFAEAFSAATGIGAEMLMANQLFDTASLITWTVLLVLVLMIIDKLLGMAEKRWFKWRDEISQ